MTEVTLNAHNNIDICLIPSKFHMLMYDRIGICTHKIGEAYLLLVLMVNVHNGTFRKER